MLNDQANTTIVVTVIVMVLNDIDCGIMEATDNTFIVFRLFLISLLSILYIHIHTSDFRQTMKGK